VTGHDDRHDAGDDGTGEVVLRLVVGRQERLAGTVGRTGDGQQHCFGGWLELMALIDQLRGDRPPNEPPDRGP